MKTWKQALALVLALVMALSLVALPSFAEGEETGGGDTGMPYIKDQGGTVEQNGLVMSKTIKEGENGQFLLTLEAYATGSTTTTTSTKPVDIVLVLDVSGSMDDPISSSETYNPVYIINNGGEYFYQDTNGQYQLAYHCDGGIVSDCSGGWFTREHGYLNHKGTQLTPKTSASDSNTSHTQFYTRTESTTKKIDALKSAVNGFIDSVAAKSADSQIAIVKFAGDKRDIVGNDTYKKGGYTYNYSQIVQDLTTVDETGASSLKTAVNGLIAAGTTLANYGMEHAQTIINGAKDNGRQKVVVMFTDGEPNGIKKVSGFEKEVANSAIANSKSIKEAGATVYTIGCFGTTPSSDTDTYMNYVSSNYPNATSMTSGGAKADPANYYKTVSSAADLNNIFQDISHTVGSTPVKLTSTSVLRDVISDSFKLPAGADKSSIKAYSVDCLSKNSDGSYSWQDKSAWTAISPENIELTDNNKTINVTGFDYAANWVDQFGVEDSPSGGTSHGKKLVVQIPIVPKTTAYGDCDTNGPASGIYADSAAEEPVRTFPSPVVYIPYFTVVHVASTVNDQGHNEGKKTSETYHPVWCNRPFNLTSVVTENYLYGGSFTGENCDTVQPYGNGENPMAFTPVDQATYYIWEVPNTYLTPRNYNVWRHLPENNGQKTVVRLYPLTTADRTLYKQVGFVIDGQNYVSGCNEFNTTINNTPTLYQTAVAEQNGQHYQTLYLSKGTIKASNTAIDESGLVNGQHIDDGCLAGICLNDVEFAKFKSDTGVTFRPYWITLDNVKVYGTSARTCTYLADSETAQVTKDTTTLPCEYVGDTVTTQAMSFAKSFTMDDSQPVVDESLTVTVVDGSNTTQVKVAPNGSIRDQVAYQAPAGKIFAGWFADQAYTIPADLDQVTEDTTIYAKYVSDSYLDLSYSRTGLFRLRGVTLISAVDNPANYQSSGIIVNGDKLNVSYASRYRIFKTPASLFGAARNAKLMLADKSLGGTGTLEVTPYWVTLDGTQVLGQTHTLHYNTRTIWE